MKNKPKLGAAKIVVSIDDKNGFMVRHGECGTVLAQKPAEQCTVEWERLWDAIRDITLNQTPEPEPDIDRYMAVTQRAQRLGWHNREGWEGFLDLAFNLILNPDRRPI